MNGETRSNSRYSKLCGLAIAAVFASVSAAQDVGFEGPSFAGVARSPTESKPQSKLWFNDGFWWGSLWSVADQEFHIHRLDQNSETWIDTGVLIDSRPDSHSDALWDGDELYVLTHDFSLTGGALGNPLRILRFSYNRSTNVYSPDAGFPVTIADSSTEAAVLEKDSTGRLWAVWIQGLRVHFSHTQGSDTSWSAPAIHPRSTSDVDTDDICSLIHFGNRIGVMWSDQVVDQYFFSFHVDGAAAGEWSPVELPWPGQADDHIDLAADSAGRVFATLKNAADDIDLAVRSSGVWQQFSVAPGDEHFSRPIVLLNEEERTILVFAKAGPLVSGGTINRKVSSMDGIGFASGPGTVVIKDDDASNLNDATSTKQNVDGSTGLVVLAQNATTERYWHHDRPGSTSGGGMTLGPVLPGLSGVVNSITVSGVTPHRLAFFFVGHRLGTSHLLLCPTTFGLDRPFHLLGIRRADGSGVATLRAFAPDDTAGKTYHFQALELYSCDPSNVVSERF